MRLLYAFGEMINGMTVIPVRNPIADGLFDDEGLENSHLLFSDCYLTGFGNVIYTGTKKQTTCYKSGLRNL
jgi:hypothetical protein